MICFHPNFSLINSILLELYMIIFRHNSQMAIHFYFPKTAKYVKKEIHILRKKINNEKKAIIVFQYTSKVFIQISRSSPRD